jgi:hypothetical protein
MQKIRLYIFFALLPLLTVSACQKDFLDTAPLDRYSDKNVWSDSVLINRFVIGIYNRMFCNYEFLGGDNLFASFTDEASVSLNKSIVEVLPASLVNLGQYTAGDNIFERVWTGVYANVRMCNLFFAHLPTLPLTGPTKQQLAGEVHFLRAYNYQVLYSLFGPFPIIDTALTLDNSKLYTQRGSDKACVDFILAEYRAAAAVLPIQYAAESDLGRVTKGAALGMQCRLLLNQKRYTDAAAMARAVMSLDAYQLFDDYGGMFLPENDDNPEVIFNKEYGSDLTSAFHSIDIFENSSYFSGMSGPADCPTQNIVDQYLMTDGLPYNESPLYDPDHPYENRDSRLGASILYDSAKWLGTVIDMTSGSLVNPIGYQSPTGYMLKKFLDPGHNFTGTNANYQNCIILRLAEIYLNYAECQLKLGNVEEARKYVNLLRQRAKMPDIPAGQMTWDAYIRERTVELAFEGERWNDIRRWNMGPQLIGAAIYGMQVTDVNGVHQYKRALIQQRYFAPRMYLFPIPLYELTKYPAGQQLQQNPGWN